jgi:glycosyltransferase involved in cell wall biosynthesis
MIEREEPSLVHTTLFDADIVARLATRGTGVPLMTTLANTTYDPERVAGDANLRQSRVTAARVVDGFTARHMTDHFHAVSEAVKSSAVTALQIDPGRVTVVHRGRDPERLGYRTPERRERARANLGLPDETELVLTVGRQEYQKGQVDLIEAFARIATDHPQALLAIAGRPGNATEELAAVVAREGLDDRVLFLGHRGDVPELMCAADLFVFPSLWEGLGGVLIEALALEVPIVASDIPALREVVVDGVNAILTPPGEAGLLGDTMRALLEDPDRARGLVSYSRQRFEEVFDLDATSNQMIDLLVSKARR